MIALALLLAVQATPPPPLTADDIVVTAARMRRLKRLQMTTHRDRRTDTYRCVFKRRSGDPELDAAVCDAALACSPKVKTIDQARACMAPALDALVKKGVPWRVGGGDPHRR